MSTHNNSYVQFEKMAEADFGLFKANLRRDINLGGEFDERGFKPLVDAYKKFIDTNGENILFAAVVHAGNGLEARPLLKAMAKFIVTGPYNLTDAEKKLLSDPVDAINNMIARFQDDKLLDICSLLENIRDGVGDRLENLWKQSFGKMLRPSEQKPKSLDDFLERPEVDASLNMHRDILLGDVFANTGYVPPERRSEQSHEEWIHSRWAEKLGYPVSEDEPRSMAKGAALEFLKKFATKLDEYITKNMSPFHPNAMSSRNLKLGIIILSKGSPTPSRVRDASGKLLTPSPIGDALDKGEIILKGAGMKDAAEYFAKYINPLWQVIGMQGKAQSTHLK